jgi:hypothetical protein
VAGDAASEITGRDAEIAVVSNTKTPGAIGGSSLRRCLVALSCLVAASCAELKDQPNEDEIAIAEAAAAVATPVTEQRAAAPEPATASPPVELEPIDEALVATEPTPAPKAPAMAEAAPAEAAPVVETSGAVATEESAVTPAPVVSSAASSAAVATLDFSSLVTRLRKTKAISLRTKVAVKHESDDLLDEFRAYHTRQGATTLAELRRSYDSLFHKLHSLLQDGDPPLARDIDRSRAAIWELLADPRKFSDSHLTGA